MFTVRMRALSALAPAFYVTGVVLTVISLTEVAISTYPIQILATEWRLGAVGILSQSLLLSAIGFILVALAAQTRSHGRVQMVLGAVGEGVVTLGIVLLAWFLVDVLLFTRSIPAGGRAGVLPATLNTLVSMGLAVAVIAATARASQLSRAPRVAAQGDESESGTLPIVGGTTRAETRGVDASPEDPTRPVHEDPAPS
jgi:hypothetical protein